MIKTLASHCFLKKCQETIASEDRPLKFSRLFHCSCAYDQHNHYANYLVAVCKIWLLKKIIKNYTRLLKWRFASAPWISFFQKLKNKNRERQVQNRKLSSNCRENHRYFVRICKDCPLNFPENGRAFSHRIKCECYRFAKGALCAFCATIRNALNTYLQ